MAQEQITLSPADVKAAIINWIQTPSNFNPPVQHQVNATVTPVFLADGSIVMQLNS